MSAWRARCGDAALIQINCRSHFARRRSKTMCLENDCRQMTATARWWRWRRRRQRSRDWLATHAGFFVEVRSTSVYSHYGLLVVVLPAGVLLLLSGRWSARARNRRNGPRRRALGGPSSRKRAGVLIPDGDARPCAPAYNVER